MVGFDSLLFKAVFDFINSETFKKWVIFVSDHIRYFLLGFLVLYNNYSVLLQLKISLALYRNWLA